MSADDRIVVGFERRLAAIERLIPEPDPWRAPEELPDGRLAVVDGSVVRRRRRSRSLVPPSTVGRWPVAAALAVVLVGLALALPRLVDRGDGVAAPTEPPSSFRAPSTPVPSASVPYDPIVLGSSAMWLEPGGWIYSQFDPPFRFVVPVGSRLWKEPMTAFAAPFSADGNFPGLTFDVLRGAFPWTDPCDVTRGQADDAQPPSDANIRRWLAASNALRVSAAETARIGGLPAARFDVTAGAECANRGQVVSNLLPDRRAFAFAAGDVHRIYVINTGEAPMAIEISARSEQALERWAADVEAILETLVFSVEGG